MDIIDLGLHPAKRVGIPVRLPPSNICDVNPWVCRMTPASINSVQAKEPAVARLSYEPFPRGCNCCAERLISPSLDGSADDYEEPKKSRRRWSLTGGKKKVKQQVKKKKKKLKKELMDEVTEKIKGRDDSERIRLLREKKRRCDFVTACCQGLMLTPCGSADSCATDMMEEKEQANFFIHTDCAPKVDECVTAKPARARKQRADFPCSCRTCKYVGHAVDSKTGCQTIDNREKTVCYCNDGERNVTDCEENLSQPSPCRTRTSITNRPATVNCVPECTPAGGKVLFTAALTQEMLIQLARHGIDTANCIPTNTQYLLDCCRRQPCIPCPQPCTPCPQPCNQIVTNCETVNPCQPEPSCRVYNCQPVQSPQCTPMPDCNATTNCNNSIQCTKVAEIDCPDVKCNVYNCEQPQPKIKCTTLPDCTTIYDLDCQPDVTHNLNNCEQPCSPRQITVCEPVCQQPIICRPLNCDRPSSMPYCSNSRNCPCYQDSSYHSYSNSRDTKASGYICIPKRAIPGSAGDMCRSKLLVPLTFHHRKEPFNSRSYNRRNRSRHRRRERVSSIHEICSSRMRRSSLSYERTSDSRNFIKSYETQYTKRSSPNISPRNSTGHYDNSAEGEMIMNERQRVKNQRIVKSGNQDKPEKIRKEVVRRWQNEPTQSKKERPRSRSPSPTNVNRSGVDDKSRNEANRKTNKEKSGLKSSSPPHFEDVEPTRRPSKGRDSYEADLIRAMDKVRRRYMEQNKHDTTSSDLRSLATTGTEPCLTPTYHELTTLTEQIKCLRRDLRKFCDADCG